MEKLSMCRMCLVENVKMYVVANKNLQDIYEKLTGIRFCTDDRRPMLACFFCCAKLQQCCRLQRKCLEAEKLFAQILNEGYEMKPLLNHGHLEFSGYIISPTEHFSFPDECQTESDVIKEELPDVCEGQDDENPAELHIENVNMKSYHSESEDDVPLMEMRTAIKEEHEVSKKKRKVNKTIKHFSIPDECQTESDVIKKELPDVCEGQDDVNPAELDHEFQHIENVNIKSYHSESEDDVPLMKMIPVKEEEKEVSKKKRKANKTIRATVAKKTKIDVRRIKQEDTITAQQKKTEQPHSKNTIPSGNNSDKGKDSNDIVKYPRLCIIDDSYKFEISQNSHSGKSLLINHIRVNTGDKPYKCDICQRSFGQNSTLTRHIRVHLGEKPYKCDVCQGSFSEKSKLTEHIRVHTGEKPYKCDICQRSFGQNSALTRHIRIHTGEKPPYKCDICQLSFGQKSALTRHILVHTGEKP